MNLTLSGRPSDALVEAIARSTHARSIAALHERAIRLSGVIDTPAVRAEVARRCADERVDHAFMEDGIHLSDYRLLAMDMDSTLITIECIDELADIAGKKAEVAAITEAAMRGELDFSESLRTRVALLEGLPVGALHEVMRDRVRLTEGAAELIEAAKANGLKTLLLSGGFTYFAERLQARLGLDKAVANVLQQRDSFLTGRLEGTIVDSQAKREAVTAFAHDHGIALQQCIAIGDGANDIPMLKAVGLSVAYHAKQQVKLNASQSITFGTLRIALDWFNSNF